MGGISTFFEAPYDLKPKNFARFAELDLRIDSKRALVNALGNIKRAIECQIDCLLCSFAFGDVSLLSEWTFPRKIRALQDLKIVTPRILERINKQRNLLEHKYELPSKNRIQDAFDVATLFLAYTERFLTNHWPEVTLGFVGTNQEFATFKLDTEKAELEVNFPSHRTVFKLSAKDPEFSRILACVLAAEQA